MGQARQRSPFCGFIAQCFKRSYQPLPLDVLPQILPETEVPLDDGAARF
jgi:hypothetical protein